MTSTTVTTPITTPAIASSERSGWLRIAPNASRADSAAIRPTAPRRRPFIPPSAPG